jgi:hypothetical protein
MPATGFFSLGCMDLTTHVSAERSQLAQDSPWLSAAWNRLERLNLINFISPTGTPGVHSRLKNQVIGMPGRTKANPL